MARGLQTRRRLAVFLTAITLCQAGAAAPALVLAAPSPLPDVTDAPAEAPRQRAPEIPPTQTLAPAPDGVEQISLRSANSETFLQPDGTFITDFFASPVFYQPEGSSNWDPIDVRFSALAGSGPNVLADKSRARVSLDAVDALTGFMVLAGGGYTIRFKLPPGVSPGRPGSRAEIKENGLFADYSDFFPAAIGMRIFAHPDGVKSFLVFNQRPLITSFSFAVDAPGLTLSKDPDGSILFKNAANAVVGRIPRPFMIDSSEVHGRGSGLYSDAVTLSLITVGPLPVISISADASFLDHAVYPVYIDPTVTQFPDASGTAYDTHATSHYPTTNFASYCRPDSPYYCEETIGREPGTTYDAETFIKFGGVQTFLDHVHVQSADLHVFPYWQYYHSEARLTWVDRVTASWTSTLLTWNNRPTTANDLNPYQFYSTQSQWGSFDVTAHMQQVVNGTMPEYGYKLHGNGTGQGNWKRIISREETGATMGDKKPYLRVQWHRPSAAPSAPISNNWSPNRTLTWTYANGDATYGTAQSQYQVQVATDTGCSTLVSGNDSGWVASSAANWTFPGTGMTEGTSYYWHVRVQDGVGWSNWSSCAQFRYDTVPPTAVITAPTQNATVSGTVTVTGTASDATSWDHYNLEYGAGSAPTSWTAIGTNPHTTAVTNGTLGSWNTSSLNGLYTIRLRAYDKARLTTGFSEALRQVTVGNGPVASISSPIASAYVRGTLTVTGTASAGSGFVNYVLSYGSGCSPSSWTQITSSTSQVVAGTLGSWNTISLGAGPYTLKLVTTAGTTATATTCITVDNTAPSATLTYPDANRPLAGTVAVIGTATDSGAFGSYDLEVGVGASPSSWTPVLMGSTTSISNSTLATWVSYPSQGTNSVRLTVRDLAGNSSTATKLVYVENSRRGEESYYARAPFDLDGGWRMEVGTANGELTLDRQFFSIPSYGPSQSLALHYSSQIADSAGMFGTGWTSNLTQYLSFENGFVVWHRGDGGLLPFGQVAGIWTPLAGHYEVLTYDSGTNRYTITMKDQSKLVFAGSAPGRLVRVENRFGKTLAFVWGGTSATATDASGRVTTLTVAAGQITAATDSAGRAWSFAYTSSALTTVTDALSKSTTLSYGAAGLTGVTRQRTPASGPAENIAWSVGYSGAVVTTIIDASGTGIANQFSYGVGSTSFAAVQVYEPAGYSSWTYSYDHLGRSVGVVDPLGYQETRAYDGQSNLTELLRPVELGPPAASQSVTYSYDSRGNPLTQTTQLTSSASVTTRMTYNATNDLLILSEADDYTALKRITRDVYDANGHLTSINVNCTTSGTTPPSDAATCSGAGTQDASTNLITTYAYTATDQVDSETDPLARVTKHTYDSFGNETSVIGNYVSGQSATSDRNVTTSFAYNQATTAGKAGLVTSRTGASGDVTTYTYDAVGRQTSETLPSDAEIAALTNSTTYDELDNILTETTTSAGVPHAIIHAYDKLNRPISQTNADGGLQTWTYDAAGNQLSSVVGGQTTIRTYDEVGNLLSEAVGGASSTYSYDGQHRPVVAVDRAGVTTDNSYDRAGRLLDEVVATPDGPLATSYTYDALGQETSAFYPDATSISTTYNRAGRPITVDDHGASTSSAFDRAGNETSSTADDGTLTTKAYDALNRVITVIGNDVVNPSLPTEDVDSHTYLDAEGNVTAVTDAAGITARTINSARRLPTKIIENCTDSGTTPTSNPASCVGAGTHDAATNVVTVISYDGFGQVISRTTAQGTSAEATTEYRYDASGRQTALRDARGTVTRLSYDAGGREVSRIINCTEAVSNPTPPTTSWWTCAGSTLHDGTWNTTTTKSYDATGALTSETSANDAVTAYTYDDAGRLVQKTDNYVAGTPLADQNISTYYAYDDGGRQSAVRRPTADRGTLAVTRFVYDSAGRLSGQIDNCTDSGTTPPGDATWFVCAGTGTADAATNLLTEYGYDSRGNRVWARKPSPAATSGNSTTTVTTRYAYDDLRRLCRVVENASIDLETLADRCSTAISGTATTNVSTRYQYDALGNLAQMTDARGNVTVYSYDAVGNLAGYSEPATPPATGAKSSYSYDALGRQTSTTIRGSASILVSRTFDAAGRTASRTADSQATSYTYDANGNLLTAINAQGTITVSYDRLNRPLTVTNSNDSGASTSYSYSLNSKSWTDPSGSYVASLDKYGRVVSLSEPVHSGSYTSAYRADGQQASLSTPSSVGLATTYGYDPAGTLTSKSTVRTQGSQSRAEYTWTRNRAGEILSETSTINSDPTNGMTSFAYDAIGRLASFTRAGVPTTYGWQAVPNRDSVTVGNGSPVTTTYSAADHPTSSSDGSSYTHDADGRLTARPGQTLVWDSVGRLIEVRNSSTNALIAAYNYDALDRLATAGTSSSRVRFRYAGVTTAVAQTVDDLTGAVTRSVANDASSEPLFDWTGTNSNQRFYGTNLHHDVTWTGTSAAAVGTTLRYDPWGNLTSSTGTPLPDFRFQGSWFDTTTSLSWAAARWYAPSLGRFVSEDPLAGDIRAPLSRHRYVYGAGDPIGNWDPAGDFFARVLSGEDARAVATRMYGVTSRWPAIYNRNRKIYRADPYRIVAGACVWVETPSGWTTTPWYSPCSGSLSDRTGYPDSRAAGALAALSLNPKWIMLTKATVKNKTNDLVGRWENPGFIETNQYKLNLAAADVLANEFLGYSRLNKLLGLIPALCQGGHWWAQDLRTALDFITANSCLPEKDSSAATIGSHVFIHKTTWGLTSGQLPPDPIVAHEYIHYLQYQARAMDFLKYAVDLVNGVATRESYYPTESIAYLWGSWIFTYEQWEQRPWRIWRPIF